MHGTHEYADNPTRETRRIAPNRSAQAIGIIFPWHPPFPRIFEMQSGCTSLGSDCPCINLILL
jgi:hypothetical protein